MLYVLHRFSPDPTFLQLYLPCFVESNLLTFAGSIGNRANFSYFGRKYRKSGLPQSGWCQFSAILSLAWTDQELLDRRCQCHLLWVIFQTEGILLSPLKQASFSYAKISYLFILPVGSPLGWYFLIRIFLTELTHVTFFLLDHHVGNLLEWMLRWFCFLRAINGLCFFGNQIQEVG